jgi:hypothetical protein
MSPDQVDTLDDEMWDAMVRHIQKEAAAIQAQAAKTKLPG